MENSAVENCSGLSPSVGVRKIDHYNLNGSIDSRRDLETKAKAKTRRQQHCYYNCNCNLYKTPLLSVVFFSYCNTWLQLCCLLFVYPDVIVYPKVHNPLTAYCIFVVVFLCSMCVVIRPISRNLPLLCGPPP